MSARRYMGLLRLACVVAIIAIAIYVAVKVVPRVEGSVKGIQASTSQSLVKELVIGPTKAVVPSYGETIWAYYVQSGAEEMGFGLDQYELAVRELNPGKDSNTFRDNTTWIVPWLK